MQSGTSSRSDALNLLFSQYRPLCAPRAILHSTRGQPPIEVEITDHSGGQLSNIVPFPTGQQLLESFEQSVWALEKQSGSWLKDTDEEQDDAEIVEMSSVLKKRHKKMKKHKHRKRLKKTRAQRRRLNTRKENVKRKEEEDSEPKE
jgi:hypothetical protein